MELYFAYGSNMRSARLCARVGVVEAVGACRLDGWTLRFDKPGRDGTGKANLVRVARSRVWGVAYTLPDEAWPILDDFEPGYERVALPVVDPAGEAVHAQVYLYADAAAEASSRPHLAPSESYLQHLIEGAREHRLPADYLERIRSVARGR